MSSPSRRTASGSCSGCVRSRSRSRTSSSRHSHPKTARPSTDCSCSSPASTTRAAASLRRSPRNRLSELGPRRELVDVDVPGADVLELEDAGRHKRIPRDELARLLLGHVLKQRQRTRVVGERPAHDERAALDELVDERRVLVPAGLVLGRAVRPRGPGAPAHHYADGLRARHAYAAAARSSSAISTLPIFSIAAITRCDFSRSGSLSSSGRRVGTICHETPNLSFSQPHGPGSPPSESLLQNESTSSWLSHLTSNEIASLGRNWGPPLRAANSRPSSSNVTVMTIPSGRGPAEP